MAFSILPRARSAMLGAGSLRSSPLLGLRWSSSASHANKALGKHAELSADTPPSTSSVEPSGNATTHYRITLRRSAIGLPAVKRRIIDSLGLHRRLGTVYRIQDANVAGSVLAIKELVHVENVRRLDGGPEEAAKTRALLVQQAGGDAAKLAAIPPLPKYDWEAIWVNEKGEVADWGGRQARKAPRGFTVVGNVVNEGRHRDIMASKVEGAARQSS